MTTDDSLTLEILTALADGSCIQCGAEADKGLFCAPCREYLERPKERLAFAARLVRLREALEEGA